jgi:hypothetical protein
MAKVYTKQKGDSHRPESWFRYGRLRRCPRQHLSPNLTHAAPRSSGDGGEHIVAFGFLRDGLLKKLFERPSASHGVAQGNLIWNDETRAQSSIGR